MSSEKKNPDAESPPKEAEENEIDSDGELSLTESLRHLTQLPKESSSPQPETPANTPTDASFLAKRMQAQAADKAKKASLIRSLVSQHEKSGEDSSSEEDSDGEEVDPLEQFTGVVRHRVEAVKALQEKYDSLHGKFLEELQALQDKYAEMYRPLLERRSALVIGQDEPKVEDFDGKEEEFEESLKHAHEDTEKSDRGKGIPGFWSRVLSNVEELEDMIQEADVDALAHLVDVRCITKPGSKDFQLQFFFDENPFFSDEMLTREYEFVDDEEDTVMRNTKGCVIHWKAGKDLTTKVKRIKKGRRTINKTKKVDSFFNFFDPPKVPEEDESSEEEDEDEEGGGVHEQLEEDLELGLFIRDKIIPNAADFFLSPQESMDVAEFVKLMGMEIEGAAGGAGSSSSGGPDAGGSSSGGGGGKKGGKKGGFQFDAPKEKCENQ